MNTDDAESAADQLPTTESHSFPVVGIGASAGGIAALKQFFTLMPADSGMAFVVILHLSKEHESSLARILQNVTSMPVIQVRKTLRVAPDTVYVIPPTKHLQMVDGSIILVEPVVNRGRRVPIDLLFRSLAEAYHHLGICIVLSGTGSDGTLGLEHIKENGGIAIVQDPEEAEYDAMPRSAIETRLADLVLPVAEMPSRLVALKAISETILTADREGDAALRLASGTFALREILTLLRNSTGHDFSSYKRPTIERRVARRMRVNGLAGTADYLRFIRDHPDELNALLRDLLISVTSFFRDPEAFQALELEVIPRLFEGRRGGDNVRVWVAACATGEEVYSLAMLLCEYAETLEDPPRIQMFASDIDARAIAVARECTYPDTIAADISPERLAKFFVQEGDRYRVKKNLRELVLFAHHNILHDPPFSQLDLISCRNLLIYVNRETQERILEIFHFALNREGFLFLGSSESADAHSTLFSTFDKSHRIYHSRPTASAYRAVPLLPTVGRRAGERSEVSSEKQAGGLSFGEIHHRLVELYAPPSVLVTEDFQIVHMSESMGRFLRVVGGEPTRALLKVVHPDLRSDLRSALMEAVQENPGSESRKVLVRLDDETIPVIVRVRRFESPDSQGTFLLVVFDEQSKSIAPEAVAGADELPGNPYVRRLEDELESAWERLRLTNVRNETSDEELRAANEELQAIIEELRSAGEELETSKEELQSVNEELQSVNHELKEKIEEVSHFNSDLQNLMASTDIATIFLDTDLRIKRYTPHATKLFNILPSDIGRPLAHLTHTLASGDLAERAAEVLRTNHLLEHETHDRDGRGYIARFLPYRTVDGAVEGVVLTFIDITDQKVAEQSRRWLSSIVSSSNDAIISFTLDEGIVSWNAAAERLFGYTEKEVLGRLSTQAIAAGDDHEDGDILAILMQARTMETFETICRRKDGTMVDVSVSISPIHDDDGRQLGATAIVQDISERKLAQQMLRNADRRKDEFLATLAHELRNPLAPIVTGLEVIKGATGSPETIESIVAVLQRQTMQLVHLVNDLLDVSRITQGKINLKREHFSIEIAVEMAVETSRPTLGDAGLVLTVTLPADPVFIDGDLTRISQVMINLLNNAAKYSEPGGEVHLSVESTGEYIEIHVKDSGIGIAPDMLSGIFEMFTQIESDTGGSRSGLGIGLKVVRELVEMHGGKVEAFSDGKRMGSEFVVSLPLAPVQFPSPDPQPTDTQLPDPDRKQLRILVVDDNADAARMLEIMLSKEDHIVRTASTGTKALQVVPDFLPDVCLLDIGLPDINGFEVARRVRELRPEAILVAVTGWGQAEDRRRSSAAGFDHHLVKPVDLGSLRELLG